MPTETDAQWITHTCKFCKHITRHERKNIALFVYRDRRPHCTTCNVVYGDDFGYTADGNLAFTHAECQALHKAANRHAHHVGPDDVLSGPSPIRYRTQADEAGPAPTKGTAYDSPDPRDWPRSGHPLRPPSDPDEYD